MSENVSEKYYLNTEILANIIKVLDFYIRVNPRVRVY